jgi:hypothetical protein
MFGLTSLFDDVFSYIQSWNPKQRYRSEDGYRDDLKEFLRTNLNKPEPFGVGPQRRIKVTSESGRHLCDITVDEKVGIELKKDLNKLAEVDRLDGQLGRYRGSYSEGIIVVLVGNTNKDTYEDLVNRVGKMLESPGISFGLTTEPRIKIVDKGFRETTSTQPERPYWINPLTGKKEPIL